MLRDGTPDARRVMVGCRKGMDGENVLERRGHEAKGREMSRAILLVMSEVADRI